MTATNPRAPRSNDYTHCETHVRLGIEDILDDAGWEQIMPLFDSVGKRRPKRALTELHWAPVTRRY